MPWEKEVLRERLSDELEGSVEKLRRRIDVAQDLGISSLGKAARVVFFKKIC
ncbi:unnamed protein product [Tenebrio molitor]|nr:unnamed protein product [Tenebrio molitor]